MGIQWLWIQFLNNDALGLAVMYSASSYYFSSEGDLSVGQAQVLDGYKLTWWKHLGSLITTIMKIVISIVESSDEGEDGAAAVLKCCITCILLCVEDALEALNRNAYANMSITGDKFCTSAYNGLMLHLRHMAKFFFAQRIASFLIFIGNLAILFLVTGIVFAILIKVDVTLGVKIAMLVATSILTLITNFLFLGLFDEAILATLQCVSIDMDFNGGTPKYGSASFQTNI